MLLALAPSACASLDYGVLREDPAVEATFKARRAYDGYAYYYYGWIGAPDAVIGLKPDYALQSKLWVPVDLNRISVGTLMDRMMNRGPTRFYGATLKAPDGRPMGVWFSDSPGATIKMAADKTIAYIRPYPLPIERDDDDLFRPGVGGGIRLRW